MFALLPFSDPSYSSYILEKNLTILSVLDEQTHSKVFCYFYKEQVGISKYIHIKYDINVQPRWSVRAS